MINWIEPEMEWNIFFDYRRETLEHLQEEQKQLLDEERRKREEFERIQQEKEKQLRGSFGLHFTFYLFSNHRLAFFLNQGMVNLL